jgi:hypothetical protein
MALPFKDRRSGTDRRRPPAAGRAKERRASDRRQFSPRANGDGQSAAASRLQQAVDAYKRERGLARVSLDQLLGILEQLGYRQA